MSTTTLERLMKIASEMPESTHQQTLIKILGRVEQQPEHLVWTGAVNSVTALPYVYEIGSGKQIPVRNFVYGVLVGPLGKGNRLLSSCHELCCLELAHFFPTSHEQYMKLLEVLSDGEE